VTIDLNDLEPFGQDVGFGFIDREVQSPRVHNPQLVLNTATDSMLRALRHELRHATSFTFSVAFVSTRAIALLKQELVDFVGVGRIVTSNYLGFNSPEAFAELLNLRQWGIDVRLHKDAAFHPKGYVFTRPDGVTAILGSSNLTETALARNHEWNLRVSAQHDSDLASQFTNLLDTELFDSVPLTQAWIDNYALTYQAPTRIAASSLATHEPAITMITPNAMQIDALRAIQAVRDKGHDRALVISATGTGKTILSALDVRTFDPPRVLFVAHREQILDRAMREFQRVLGAPDSDFGKLAGTTRQIDRRYLFATVQTLSQQGVLDSLDPVEFDYVLIDEVHRAGASSFGRVLSHFRPKFLLGMTATPERTDGENIFEIFDYNVPYEIRLNDALSLDMLAPFHYYGVADITYDDGLTTTDATTLGRLAGSQRVRHILKALQTYGQAGVAPRGLIFCGRKDEAQELSRVLNEQQLRGKRLRTVALTGEDSIERREHIVEQLEAGELDYVLTVDIFNEGVDIPTINQVIMLRQTKSSIVFVQQLGRGLRKADGKDYLVVIDFIGNYANNYLIPIALFGDNSLNKESLRKNLISAEEIGVMAGLSSVRFDRISQERVLSSLSTVKLDSLPNLKSAIESVQRRVGRVPRLFDFLRFESVDPIVLATKLGNYLELLAKLKIQPLAVPAESSLLLSVLSRELLSAKRPQELLLLRALLRGTDVDIQSLMKTFEIEGVTATDATARSAVRSLTLEFNTASEVQAFASGGPAIFADGIVRLTVSFAAAYSESESFRASVDDLVETGLAVIAERYNSSIPFTPGRQYSRKDASRLLNWQKNMYSTIYGYRVDTETKTCPIFITLQKSDEVTASTAYEDELVDTRTMRYFSKSRRTLASPDVRPMIENIVDLHVFAKKSDAEGSDFYYLGLAKSSQAEQTTMRDNGLSIVRMLLNFDRPIDAALFDYFHTDLTD
jgi:superfamily II DNA or RNA helicase/HKD family nuclease